MTTMGCRAAVLAATIAILLGGAPVAAQPPAHPADRVLSQEIPWNMAPCASAHLWEAEWDISARLFVVTGTATQCTPVVSDGGFRIATYLPDEPTGRAPGYNVRLFPSATPDALRLFGTAAVPRQAGQYGVCVLAGAHERITCALVTVSQNGTSSPRATVEPLNPERPLVAKAVVVGPYTGRISPPSGGSEPNPTCGTCF